ncbi:MAG: hypothetical protein NZZ41_07190 [Candidatus Dojkabacteria bacterium]|nr:hypothetical protein [Candidatus Dojkabacteria bacterium]
MTRITISELQDKYGSSIVRNCVKLFAEGKLDDFINDISQIKNILNSNQDYILVFPDSKSLSKFYSLGDSFVLYNLGGYVSLIENKKIDDLNISDLENISKNAEKVVCVFDDSAEAQITFNELCSRLSWVQVVMMPFGVSARGPQSTDEYTFQSVLRSILR